MNAHKPRHTSTAIDTYKAFNDLLDRSGEILKLPQLPCGSQEMLDHQRAIDSLKLFTRIASIRNNIFMIQAYISPKDQEGLLTALEAQLREAITAYEALMNKGFHG